MQINQMLNSLEIFENSCENAALMDDNMVSREERKQLDKIHKATLAYKKELQKLS